MENEKTITRREFLKLAGSAALGSFIPKEILDIEESKEIKFFEDTPDECVPYSSILSSLNYEYGENEEQQFIQNYLFHLGVNNLTTCYDSKNNYSFIINGKELKSINQYYNKKKGEIQSQIRKNHNKYWCNDLSRLTMKRNNKITD